MHPGTIRIAHIARCECRLDTARHPRRVLAISDDSKGTPPPADCFGMLRWGVAGNHADPREAFGAVGVDPEQLVAVACVAIRQRDDMFQQVTGQRSGVTVCAESSFATIEVVAMQVVIVSTIHSALPGFPDREGGLAEVHIADTTDELGLAVLQDDSAPH